MYLVSLLVFIFPYLVFGSPSRSQKNSYQGSPGGIHNSHQGSSQNSLVDWSPIVPKFLAPWPPEETLRLSFSGLNVEPNQNVDTGDMTQRPSVKWDWVEAGDLYTVIIADLHLTEREGGKQYIHWFITNIPGTHVSQGDEVFEYVPPFSFDLNEDGTLDQNWVAPEPMVAMAFRQRRGRVQAEEFQAGCNPQKAGSRIIDFKELAEKYNLGLVAATYFNAPYSEATNVLLCEFSRCLGGPFPAPLFGVNDGPNCQANP